jgi:hypothetical protein
MQQLHRFAYVYAYIHTHTKQRTIYSVENALEEVIMKRGKTVKKSREEMLGCDLCILPYHFPKAH